MEQEKQCFPPATCAILKAGGRGTRMSTLGCGPHKFLLPINGVPILCYALEDLLNAGLSAIVITVNPAFDPALLDELQKTLTEASNLIQGPKLQVVISEDADWADLKSVRSLAYSFDYLYLSLVSDLVVPESLLVASLISLYEKPDSYVGIGHRSPEGLLDGGVLFNVRSIRRTSSDQSLATDRPRLIGRFFLNCEELLRFVNYSHSGDLFDFMNFANSQNMLRGIGANLLHCPIKNPKDLSKANALIIGKGNREPSIVSAAVQDFGRKHLYEF